MRVIFVFIFVFGYLFADFIRDDVREIVLDTSSKVMWQDDSNASSIVKNWRDSIDYCESLDMAGHSDWYLPNKNELFSIVDNNLKDPSIRSVFQNVDTGVNKRYWTSTTNNDMFKNKAWFIYFSYGGDAYYYKTRSTDIHVRCIRDWYVVPILKTGQTVNIYSNDDGKLQMGADRTYIRDNLRNVVTNSVTKLMWQDDSALDNDAIRNFDEANNYCQDLILGGYSDWRLPTIEELTNIANKSNDHPSIEDVFQHAKSDYYWSSTPCAWDSNQVWLVNFRYGGNGTDFKTYYFYVRCVRDNN